MCFEGDWTGLFLRGDTALGEALALEEVLEHVSDADGIVLAKFTVQGLLDLMRSAQDPRPDNDPLPPQRMLAFRQCVRTSPPTHPNDILFTHPHVPTEPCFKGLKHIGYWRQSDKYNLERDAEVDTWKGPVTLREQWERRYPWPGDLVDPDWDPRERLVTVRYLKAGKVNYAYDGWSECRLCGKHNGGKDLTDGTWGWPDGYAHYVEDHGVRPPADFVNHVLRALGVRP